MASMKVACVVLMCMVVMGAAPIAQAISCAQVINMVTPCMPYLQRGGTVPGQCCNGVKTLVSSAGTLVDKQTVCNCLKSTAAKIPGLNFGNAESLPGKCGVKLPYKISPSTNCANIKF